jgi:hypothetical protein
MIRRTDHRYGTSISCDTRSIFHGALDGAFCKRPYTEKENDLCDEVPKDLMTYGLHLNPNQPVTNNAVRDNEIMTNDNQSSTMYENTASMYQENITHDSENRLNSIDDNAQAIKEIDQRKGKL